MFYYFYYNDVLCISTGDPLNKHMCYLEIPINMFIPIATAGHAGSIPSCVLLQSGVNEYLAEQRWRCIR